MLLTNRVDLLTLIYNRAGWPLPLNLLVFVTRILSKFVGMCSEAFSFLIISRLSFCFLFKISLTRL